MRTVDGYLADLATVESPEDTRKAGPIRLVAARRPVRSPVLAAAVTAATLWQPASGAPGDLDPTFGAAGRAVVPSSQYGEAWAIEALDGDATAYGGGDTFCDGYYHYTCGVMGHLGRLLESGAVDTSFAPGFLANTRVSDLAVQADGKIVGIGTRLGTNADGLLVFRMLPNGTLDPAFPGGGASVLAAPPGETQQASSVIVDDQQRIVIAGHRDGRLLVMRLQADGTLDLGFGAGGVYVGPELDDYDSLPRVVAPAGNGYRVMLNTNGCRVVSLTPAGSVDTSFGASGEATPVATGTAACGAFAMQQNGDLVLGGTTNGQSALWRLRDTGSRDTLFAGGSVSSVLADVTALAIGPGSRVLAAGHGLEGESPAVITRVQASGQLDATFGAGGVALVEADGHYDGYPTIRDMKVLASGRMLLAGGAYPDGYLRPFIARLLADGEAGPGILSIATHSVATSEEAGQAVVKVRRLGGRAGAVSVGYGTLSSEASTTSAEDFGATSGRLEWADGDVSEREVVIPIKSNTFPLESGETFELTLSDAQGGAGLGARSSFIQIRGDGYPNGAFSARPVDRSVAETEGPVQYIVERLNFSQGAVSVTMSVVGITATAGQDYTAVEPITFTWADGDSSTRIVTISVADDKQKESEESLTVSLSNATGGAIIDPAPPQSVTIRDKPMTVGSGAGSGGGGGAFGALGALLLGWLELRRARNRFR